MNLQKLFDAAVEGLAKQEFERSLRLLGANPGHVCCYRGENGQKCLIGQVLPDEIYESEMESHSIDYVIEHFPKVQQLLGVVGEPEMSDIVELQNCHDDASDADGMVRDLILFAKDRGLKVPEVLATEAKRIEAQEEQEGER